MLLGPAVFARSTGPRKVVDIRVDNVVNFVCRVYRGTNPEKESVPLLYVTCFSRNDFPTWVKTDLAYVVFVPPPPVFRTLANHSVQFPTSWHRPALIKLSGEIFIKHQLSAPLGQRPLVLIDKCKYFTGESLRSREAVEAPVSHLGHLHLQDVLPPLLAPLSPFPNGFCEPQGFYFSAQSLITCMSLVDLRGNGVGHLLNGA